MGGDSKRVSKTKLLSHAKYLRYLHNFFTVLLEHPSGFCMKILKCQCWPRIFIFSQLSISSKTVKLQQMHKICSLVKGDAEPRLPENWPKITKICHGIFFQLSSFDH